jgi:hypothetical protein
MRRLLYTLRDFGLDPIKSVLAVRELAWFITSYFRFRRLFQGKKLVLAPTLHDRKDSSGSSDGHYFWQDLICARWIFEDNPRNHLDIGSRIDGFVAHLLSFRDVDVIDIRRPETSVPGLNTIVADAQLPLASISSKYSSVSSLHSLEHFGLGRYGDKLDPNGHRQGLLNIADLVDQSGFLYVSYPIGDDEVQFNAQRLLRPNWAPAILNEFNVIQAVLIPWRGEPKYVENIDEYSKFKAGSCILFKLQRK